MLPKSLLVPFLLGPILSGTDKTINDEKRSKICNTTIEYNAVNQDIIDLMFDWKWLDNPNQYLGPKNFQVVQISLPTEGILLRTKYSKRPWYKRDQSISYKLDTRSGNQSELINLTRRCNPKTGLNMAANPKVGSRVNAAGFKNISYLTVPYEDIFDNIKNLDRASDVYTCELKGYKNQSYPGYKNQSYPGYKNQLYPHVRRKLNKEINVLSNFAATPFRIQNPRLMILRDLKNITSYSNSSNIYCGFVKYTKPKYYGRAKPSDYSYLGRIKNYTLSEEYSTIFCGENSTLSCSTWSANPSDLTSIYSDFPLLHNYIMRGSNQPLNNSIMKYISAQELFKSLKYP